MNSDLQTYLLDKIDRLDIENARLREQLRIAEGCLHRAEGEALKAYLEESKSK
jgi:hypothetical protein